MHTVPTQKTGTLGVSSRNQGAPDLLPNGNIFGHRFIVSVLVALFSDEDSSTFSDEDPHEIRGGHKN